MLDVDEDVERICRGCVGEDFLRGMIDRDGVISGCAFCGSDEETTITV